MKITIEFDSNNDNDIDDFRLAMQAEDYKDAFQAVWKYVHDQIKHHADEHHEPYEFLKHMSSVEERITKIAEEFDVEVW